MRASTGSAGRATGLALLALGLALAPGAPARAESPVPAAAPAGPVAPAAPAPQAAPPGHPASAAPPEPSAAPVPNQGQGQPCTPEALGGPLTLPLQLPPELDALRRLFLDGKCALIRGDAAGAEALFRRGLAQDKRLPTLWALAVLRAQVAQGEAVDSLATLALALDGHKPAVQPVVRQLLTDPDGKVANSPMEFDDLATYFVHTTPGVEDYDLLERLYALAETRKDDGLLKRLPPLLWRMPKDEATARRWAAASAGPHTPGDWVAREQRLTDLRLSRLLTAELESAALPALDPDNARRLGRLYFNALLRDRNYRQAAAQIQDPAVTKRFAFDPREQLATAIRVELRRQVIAPVLKWLQQLEALTPKPDSLPGIYLDLARYYDQRHERKAVGEWCRRIVKDFPQSGSAPSAWWMLVWGAYAAGDFKGAAAWSTQAIGEGTGFSPGELARLHYWLARSQERLGDAAGAAKTRATLLERWPSTYYGLILAPGSISAPAPAKFHEIGVSPAPPGPPELKRVWTVPALADAIFVRTVGEEDLAETLLRQVLAQPLPEDVVAELARLFHYAQAHYLAQRLIANQTAGEHVTQPVANSPFWRQAYPPAYWDLVKDESGAQEVSPFFVLAIMREESRFHIKADSRAGAKGLMQIMPSTAKEIARREKAKVSDDALLSPELNIPLGVRYLRSVLHRFDWNPIYAAAAYNAGPGAVSKWTRSMGQLPLDEFVESIPYEETQNYVRRVYSSYLIYRKLYR